MKRSDWYWIGFSGLAVLSLFQKDEVGMFGCLILAQLTQISTRKED